MQLELSQLNVRKWWELMINVPQPGEIWLVSTNTEEKIVSRLMLIVLVLQLSQMFYYN